MSKTMKMNGRKVEATEDTVDVKYIINFENTGVAGQDVGALLLEKNGKLELKFCFGTVGTHNDTTKAQAALIISQWIKFIQDMLFGESVTIDRNNFPSWRDRYDELDRIQHLDDSNPCNGMIWAEKESLRDISTRHDDRKRNKPSTTIWTSVSKESIDEKLDLPSKIINGFEKFIKTRSGQLNKEHKTYVSKFLLGSWRKYLRWNDIFHLRMSSLGEIRVYDAHDTWEHSWEEINRFSEIECPAIPHLLRIDVQTGMIKEEVDESHSRNTAVTLFSAPSSIPHNDYTHILQDGRYIVSAALVANPDGWAEEFYQLNWLPDALANTPDTRCVFQFTAALQGSVAEKLRSFSSDAVKGMNSASERGQSVVRDLVQLERAGEAERALLEGSMAIKYGLCFFFHNKNLTGAIETGNSFCEKLGTNGKRNIIQLERVTNQRNWYQSLPITQANLLSGTPDRRMTMDSVAAAGLLPLGTCVSKAKKGMEMRSKYGRSPIYLDIEGNPGHINIYGITTEAGKTMLAAMINHFSLASGRYSTIIDIAKNGRTASFKDYAQKLMGAHCFDIVTGAYNIMMPPDRPKHLDRSDPDWIEMNKDAMNSIQLILLTAVLGANLQDKDFNTTAVDSVLNLVLNSFYSAREVQLRFRAAKQAGLGTEEWDNVPTVVDFIKYCTVEKLPPAGRGKASEDDRILGHIRSRLTSWFVGENCKAPSLSKPSTIESNGRLLVIVLRDFSSDDEAAVFGLVAQGLAFKRALRYMKQGTFLFSDENNIALRYASLARGLASLYANGLKANMVACSAMQLPEKDSDSAAISMIKGNTKYNFVGKIAAGYEYEYAQHIGLPVEIVARCAQEGWGVNKRAGYSSWLFSQEGHNCFVEIEPQKVLLGVMNRDFEKRDLLLAGVTEPFEVFKVLQEA